MKLVAITPIFGAFRVLRKRLRDINQPSISVWTDAGEVATKQLGAGIEGAAHKSETYDAEARKELAAGLAGLKDRRVDPVDLAHFEKAARLVARSEELDHDIGEACRS